MIKPSDEHRRVLTSLFQSRTGTILLEFLALREKAAIDLWVASADIETQKLARGKITELKELAQLFNSLSISKE